MKIIHKDIRHGELKIIIDSLDDLWYLSHIITENDFVSGKTFRKIKIGDSENAKVVKKPFWLKIQVTKIEFSKYSDVLRISGTVIEGPEEIPNGSYHTFNLQENTEIKIEKKQFLSYQLDKLDEASSDKVSPILMIVLDREEAHFALLKKQGYDYLLHLSGEVEKKGMEQRSSNFYKEISNQLNEYFSRYKIENILIASPAFFKEDFLKEVDISIKDKIVLATVSSADKSAFSELLKREEVRTVLKKDKSSKEAKLVEEVMREISLNGKACYGLNETSDCANSGAISDLLVSDNLILKYRQEDKYEVLDLIMQLVDKNKGKINIISSDHDAGKQLDGLGGIAGLLRYKIG
jgi:protein pelota